MNNIDNSQFHIGRFGANRWIAVTLQSPYLCFEAESRDALLIKLKEGLAFCQPRERETQPFLVEEIISATELEDA
jgi:hypothetical protein